MSGPEVAQDAGKVACPLFQTETWDKQGVTLHLIDMGGASFFTSSAVGRMFLTMLAGFAQFERDLIAERTAAALATKRAKRTVYTRKTPRNYLASCSVT